MFFLKIFIQYNVQSVLNNYAIMSYEFDIWKIHDFLWHSNNEVCIVALK